MVNKHTWHGNLKTGKWGHCEVMEFTHSELCNLGLFEEHLGRGDDGDEDGGG